MCHDASSECATSIDRGRNLKLIWIHFLRYKLVHTPKSRLHVNGLKGEKLLLPGRINQLIWSHRLVSAFKKSLILIKQKSIIQPWMTQSTYCMKPVHEVTCLFLRYQINKTERRRVQGLCTVASYRCRAAPPAWPTPCYLNTLHGMAPDVNNT
jgi:hypothetical protein